MDKNKLYRLVQIVTKIMGKVLDIVKMKVRLLQDYWGHFLMLGWVTCRSY